MKPFLTLVAMIVALIPMALGAQEAPPTPPGDPLEYNDAAMHFRVPAGYYSVGNHPVDLADLPEDLSIVAAWVLPGDSNQRKIFIQMASFNSRVDDFETVYEQQIRGQVGDATFKNKKRMTLKNGMPAYYVEMESGSGFDTAKSFIVLWTDGQRGVALVATGKLSAWDEAKARAALSDASAVRYPTDRG